MAARLSAEQTKVWTLHTAGFSVTQICDLTGMPDTRVRAIVCGMWYDDKKAKSRG